MSEGEGRGSGISGRAERRDKKWNETKTNDSWSIFKIMGEFVEGYEKLSAIGPCISIFGSARTKPDHKYYKLAEEISEAIVERGYGVITGGGPGIMEAANRGAAEAGGQSIGLTISLPYEATKNEFISQDLNLKFHYFFMRKFWFLYSAKAFVVWPGGFGTLDELMELLTLIQTRKIKKRLPIVLYGKDYWKNVINWKYLVDIGTISKEDLKLFHISDEINENLISLIERSLTFFFLIFQVMKVEK